MIRHTHEVVLESGIAIRRHVAMDEAGSIGCLLAEERTGKKIQQFFLKPVPGGDFQVKMAVGKGRPDERLMTMARELAAG